MSIWAQLFGTLKGGWKTYGPNAIFGPGAFDSGSDPLYDSVSAEMALRLSAVWACMNLRAETIGSLPLQLRDKDKKLLTDHPLYDILKTSPNAMMTSSEFGSLVTAHKDMYGNAISIINRRKRDKSVISLDPVTPTNVTLDQEKSGMWFYHIGADKYAAEDVLHLRSFSMNGFWGIPRLDIGRQILSAQLSANTSAQTAFKQGLKVGGFFKPEQNLNETQLNEFNQRMGAYGRPENAGKFMMLLKGMEPVAGTEFRVKPVDAELLSSRFFGIEEICRLFGVPPPLIGHTDKASSWASSIEQLNLFFLMYSLMPTFIRDEQSITKRLLTPYDRAAGITPKYNVQSLLRADSKTQTLQFASALQNGYLNRNEVRELLERGQIDGGDQYTVQLNMTTIDQALANGAAGNTTGAQQ